MKYLSKLITHRYKQIIPYLIGWKDHENCSNFILNTIN